MILKNIKFATTSFLLLFVISAFAQPVRPQTEADYYEIKTIPIPEDVMLEVGGIAVLQD
jgi:hypothetical protein